MVELSFIEHEALRAVVRRSEEAYAAGDRLYNELCQSGVDENEAELAAAELSEREGEIGCTCENDLHFRLTALDHEEGCPYHAAMLIEAEALRKRQLFVNVYLDDQAYGGPEEGGWWYGTSEILAVYPVPSAEAGEKLIEWLESEEYSNEGRREIHSVLSEGRYRCALEFTPGENSPTTRPVYE